MRSVLHAVTAMVVATFTLLPARAVAQPPTLPDACNQAMTEPSAQLALGGTARALAVTRDGCWLFVKVSRTTDDGVAVFRRSGGAISQVRFHGGLEKSQMPSANVMLTHDESVLLVRAGRQVLFFDVRKLTSGLPDAVVGAVGDQHFAPTGGMAITPDDKYAFVSHPGPAWISIIDLEKARGGGNAAIVGGIPTALTASSLVLSPDGRLLYALGRPLGMVLANPEPQSQSECRNDRGLAGFMVIDVHRAAAGSGAGAVIGSARGGCGAPSLAISRDGLTLFETSPQRNVLLAFDTDRSGTGAAPRRIAEIPVGPAPRYAVTTPDGQQIFVSNTNDLAGEQAEFMGSSYLTVIDATKLAAGAAAVLGTIPAGPAPSAIVITSDGRTLLITDSKSQTLQIVDLNRLTPDAVR